MAENRINPRRERVLQEYTDPSSPAFGNATQATLLAYPNMNPASAKTHGHRVLSNAHETGVLDQWTKEYQDNTRVRIRVLEDVALGEHVAETTTTHKDKDGVVTHSQETASKPAAMAIVRANDVLAKLDGTYAQQQIARDAISTDYRTIVDRQRRELNRGRAKPKTKRSKV